MGEGASSLPDQLKFMQESNYAMLRGLEPLYPDLSKNLMGNSVEWRKW